MHYIIAFSRQDDGLLFWTEDERRSFLARALRLGARWGVSVRAFHISRGEAELLVHARADVLDCWIRLVHSGHSTAVLQGRGRHIPWAKAEVAGCSDAMQVVRHLHGLEPWSSWTSLWDAAGLRSTPLFKATWLQEQASPQQHFRDAGGPNLPFGDGPLAPATWEQIQAAVDTVTWLGDCRATRVLTTQLAYRAGWRADTLAAMLGVGPAAIRKSLSAAVRPELFAAQAHLRHPALRALLVEQAPTQRFRIEPEGLREALVARSGSRGGPLTTAG